MSSVTVRGQQKTIRDIQFEIDQLIDKFKDYDQIIIKYSVALWWDVNTAMNKLRSSLTTAGWTDSATSGDFWYEVTLKKSR